MRVMRAAEGGQHGPRCARYRLPGRVVVYDGDAHGFDVPDPLDIAAEGGRRRQPDRGADAGAGEGGLRERGQTVAKGARLAVLEAMKMEHVLTAGRDGVVAEVLVAEGSQVAAGAPLIVLEAEEDAA
jgi:3-methylcrotonyl-CoA carboxylase alpha subunit